MNVSFPDQFHLALLAIANEGGILVSLLPNGPRQRISVGSRLLDNEVMKQ